MLPTSFSPHSLTFVSYADFQCILLLDLLLLIPMNNRIPITENSLLDLSCCRVTGIVCRSSCYVFLVNMMLPLPLLRIFLMVSNVPLTTDFFILCFRGFSCKCLQDPDVWDGPGILSLFFLVQSWGFAVFFLCCSLIYHIEYWMPRVKWWI